MKEWTHHIIFFLFGIVLYILFRIYLPSLIIIPILVSSFYFSLKVMTPDRIKKIVCFILGKNY